MLMLYQMKSYLAVPVLLLYIRMSTVPVTHIYSRLKTLSFAFTGW